MKKIILTLLATIISLCAFAKNASITISNRSDYTITVKVMRLDGGLYTTRVLAPHSNSTVSFPKSGYYYTKTKAEKSWESTIYKKGSAFDVYCESDGYTEGTLEFYVSSYGGASGSTISASEFEKNY